MSPTLRFVLPVFVSFHVASSALGTQLSAETFGNWTGGGGQVLFSDSSGSLGPPYGPSAVSVAAGEPLCLAPPVPPTVICGNRVLGAGEASADLAAGTLGVYVAGQHDGTEISSFVARVSFVETLVFRLPAGMTSAQVTISMSVEADLPQQNINGRVGGGALIGFGQDASFLYFQGVAGSRPSHFSQVLQVTTTVVDGLPIDVTAELSGVLLLVQNDPGPYVLDALHTAALSISLPPGVTYESNSRVFLTQVDEPSFVHLLGSSALGALAAARPVIKRRRIRV